MYFQKVSIPVLLTGGVKTLSDAEDLLADGAADLIGVGRELMKDPCCG
jgi:2,4-dienoyl-CoA reductase-like NADH-dependent reductase (Old Yellow Enzyme family)